MRRARTALLATWISMVLPGAGEARTCVTACEAAARRCAQRCTEETSESFRRCELACAQSYFVACFSRCVQTGVARVPDPFAEPAPEEAEEPDDC